MVTVEKITSSEELEKIAPEWERLTEDDSSLFLSHAWFLCCVVSYGKGKELIILVVKENNRIIGIAPFWRYRDTMRGIQVRKIGFITCPDTPHADFIINKDRRGEFFKALLDHLYKEKKSIWDIVILDQLSIDSPNYRALKSAINNNRKKGFSRFSTLTPYISIQGDWDTYIKSRSAKFRKTHRNIINRVNRLGEIEVTCMKQGAGGDGIQDLFHVSERSWKEKEGKAITSSEESKRFFQLFTELAGRNNWLFLWILKVNGTPVAMEYDLEKDGKVYALRADFDEGYRDHSPGSYLEYHIVKHLFDEGYHEYNTGPGLNTYKMQWADKLKKTEALHICNTSFKGRMIWILEDCIISFLKRIRNFNSQASANKY